MTLEVMTDPVMAADGHTYERAAMERWLAKGKTTSPKTGAPLEMMAVFPNHMVRRMIMEWQEAKAQRAANAAAAAPQVAHGAGRGGRGGKGARSARG